MADSQPLRRSCFNFTSQDFRLQWSYTDATARNSYGCELTMTVALTVCIPRQPFIHAVRLNTFYRSASWEYCYSWHYCISMAWKQHLLLSSHFRNCVILNRIGRNESCYSSESSESCCKIKEFGARTVQMFGQIHGFRPQAACRASHTKKLQFLCCQAPKNC